MKKEKLNNLVIQMIAREAIARKFSLKEVHSKIL